MSKETEYQKVMTIKNLKVVTLATCDGCGKTESHLPESWHEFSCHHDDWCNDSIDTYEDYHACSPECYLKALKKAFIEFEHYHSAEIDNFKYDFVKKLIEMKLINESEKDANI